MNSLPSYNHSQALASLADESYQLYFVYNLQHRELEYINAAFEEIWQISREECMRNLSYVLETIHPEDRRFAYEQYEKIYTNGSFLQRKEFRIVVPGGATKWIKMSARCVGQHDQIVYIAGFAEDVTPVKAYIDKLIADNAQKNTVLEIIAHDLAAPFSTIQGLVNTLHVSLAHNPDPEVRQLLTYIQDTCKRGMNLIHDFINQKFLESSQIELRKQRVDIVKKVRQFLSDFQHTEAVHARKLEVISLDTPIFARVDELKFVQVIYNLVSNAVKFTREDGKILIAVTEQEKYVLLVVQDDGIGISKGLQTNLFDKFTKSRRSGLRGEKSVGLGLSIVKTIVELHQGRIWVESEENQGTTFFIQFPKE
jgi:two-component system, OmpR family, sensor histidine kinase VicK